MLKRIGVQTHKVGHVFIFMMLGDEYIGIHHSIFSTLYISKLFP